jgi:hypothetical protein
MEAHIIFFSTKSAHSGRSASLEEVDVMMWAIN